MKFLDIKTDYTFKKVFGNNQSHGVLLSFLNSVIHFNGNLKIKSLEIVDPYNIPMIKGMKDSYVDVKARLDDDSLVIIEMQVLNHQGFEKRVLYNAAKNYSIQLNQSDDYHLLNPVIALSIVDFTMFAEHDNVISHFKLLEKEKFIHYSDDIELTFIELPKFHKSLTESKPLQEKWIYFIQNSSHFDSIPEDLEPEIRCALDFANEANLSTEELELQRKRKDFIYIQKSSIELAKEQALAQGLEEGLEKGLEQGALQALTKVVINSYQAGIPVPSICDITGLNVSVINTIIEELNKQ